VGLTVVTYEAEDWGLGELWAQDGRLVWHELPTAAGPPRASSHFQPIWKAVTDGRRIRVGSVTLSGLAERLRAYFAGRRAGFADVELELEWATPFQLAVTDTLRAVPYGETVTYGELAALAGFPNAQRAAGTYCARNHFAILVPCHRVVAADGLGSYGSLGPTYKRRLLELERAL
jgi:methylated-DNA-[protein]-cysteine S-methyltransferase